MSPSSRIVYKYSPEEAEAIKVMVQESMENARKETHEYYNKVEAQYKEEARQNSRKEYRQLFIQISIVGTIVASAVTLWLIFS